jgi:ADP-ribose pyrophosphatase
VADQDLHETFLSSETVFNGRMIQVVVDQVRLPNGKQAAREVVKHPGAVAVLAMDGDQILFVRQYRHPVGQVLIELPAGKLEAGETAQVCAARELHEETGLAAETWIPLGKTVVSPGFTNEVIHLFRAEGLKDADGHAADPDEFIDLERMTLPQALQAIRDGRIVDAKTQVALLMTAAGL